MRTRRISGDTRNEAPVLLVKWYDVSKWLLDRVDSFPKNQRFIFGQRIADRAMTVLEVLVEAAYSPRKEHLLARANRDIEVLRWQVRMAMDRKILTPRRCEYCCLSLNECGRMVVGYDRVCLERTRRHERWGPFFIPAYVASSLVCRLRGRDPYRANRFEREAYDEAG